MVTLGVLVSPHLPPETLPRTARLAEDAGLAELWITEDCFLSSGIAMASVALAGTVRLRIGIGILPVPMRNVALCAMEIATLRRMFGERLTVGIGHGVQEWMAQAGTRAGSPLTLLREYATALRALLDGRIVTTEGRYVNLDSVALAWPPDPPPRLLIGATGPKSLRLSGEVGDGTILGGGVTTAEVRAAAAHIAATGAHEIVVLVTVAAGSRRAERPDAHQHRGGPEAPVVVAGDPAQIVDALTEYAAAGATRVVLEPPPGDPDPEAFIRFVAEHLQPLFG